MGIRRYFLVFLFFPLFAYSQIGGVPACPGAFGNTKLIEGPLVLNNASGVIEWTKDTIYILKNNIQIDSGTTLRISAGTIVMGLPAPCRSYLTLRAGAKIQAVGNANNPIVFTSCKLQGTRSEGDWGGIVLLGAAGRMDMDTLLRHPIDSLSCRRGNPNDNSGTLSFVRIEFAGATFDDRFVSTKQRTAGLLLVGVGPKTILQNIQVSHSYSDSYHFYNSHCNARNLVSWKPIDDDFEFHAHKGLLQFGLGYRDYSRAADFEIGSNGIECKGEKEAFSSTQISNFELWGPVSNRRKWNDFFVAPFFLTHNAQLSIYNSLALGWPTVSATSNGTNTELPSMCDCPFGEMPDPEVATTCPASDGFCVPSDVINRYTSLYKGISGFLLSPQAYTNLRNGRLKLKANTMAAHLENDPLVGAYAGFEDTSAQDTIMESLFHNALTTDIYNGLIVQKKAPLRESPLFALIPSAPLNAGASFYTSGISSDLPIGYIFDAATSARGFAKVAYRGAFGGSEWTLPWTQYNPNITRYESGTLPTKKGEPFLRSQEETPGTEWVICTPNPCSEGTKALIHVSQPSELTIKNSMGERVWHQTISPGEHTIPLPSEHWPAGLYLVQTQNTRSPSTIFKLLIRR